MGFKRWKDKLGTWERRKGPARQEKSVNKGVSAIPHDRQAISCKLEAAHWRQSQQTPPAGVIYVGSVHFFV